MQSAVLTIVCPDRPGLVATFAGFVLDHGGNILDSEHHRDEDAQLFITRLHWSMTGFNLDVEATRLKVREMVHKINGAHELFFSPRENRVAIFVSKQNHCLYDLLIRQRSGDLNAEIPLVISNHEDLRPVAKQFDIDFHHLPTTPPTRSSQEAKALEICESYGVNLIVLAKYMQILSPDFLKKAPKIINIHHSFLPAFPGGRPYHSAYARGVKMIGATAHYVTEDLDEGPIIAQDVKHIDHSYGIADLVREGKDVERVVLAKAVRHHLEHKIVVYKNRTAVF